jgi:hypothetical protein
MLKFLNQFSACLPLLVQIHPTLEAKILVTSRSREREAFFIGPPGGLDVRLR